MKRALLLFAVACGHAPTLPAPLSAFRDATGGGAWDRVQAIDTHAALSVGGMTGTLDTIEDVPSGRSRTTVALGAITQAEGWDGAAAWEHAPGGEVVVKDTPSAVAEAKTGAWLTHRGYFRTTGASYRDLGAQGALHGVEATPDGGTPGARGFDARGLLARSVDTSGADTTTTDYTDYRSIGGGDAGIQIPFHVTVDQGDPRNRLTIDVTAAKLVGSPEQTAFAAPRVDADRISSANGLQKTQIPFELINNHIYIHATVDGQPLRVMVDTGGLNMLTPAAAQKLGIAVEGKMAGGGAGSEKVDVGFGHARTLTVGDVSLASPIFYVMDTGKLADVEGEELEGLVGFELFSRLRVRIDYPGRVLTLMSPQAFSPPAGAVAVPFEMSDRTPIVQGAIDGIPGRFWVDTGSRVSLTTMSKFTREHDLVAKYKPPFETITGWGVGGSTSSSPVRFHEVKIGAAVVRDVVGDLFTGDKGAFADPDAAGNVGGGLLHRYVVTFDYAGKVMYLEGGSDEHEVYDRSGLFVVRDGDALRVISAAPHSPAQAAGLPRRRRSHHRDRRRAGRGQAGVAVARAAARGAGHEGEAEDRAYRRGDSDARRARSLARDPAVEGAQRPGLEPARPALPVAPARDQPGALERRLSLRQALEVRLHLHEVVLDLLVARVAQLRLGDERAGDPVHGGVEPRVHARRSAQHARQELDLAPDLGRAVGLLEPHRARARHRTEVHVVTLAVGVHERDARVARRMVGHDRRAQIVKHAWPACEVDRDAVCGVGIDGDRRVTLGGRVARVDDGDGRSLGGPGDEREDDGGSEHREKLARPGRKACAKTRHACCSQPRPCEISRKLRRRRGAQQREALRSTTDECDRIDTRRRSRHRWCAPRARSGSLDPGRRGVARAGLVAAPDRSRVAAVRARPRDRVGGAGPRRAGVGHRGRRGDRRAHRGGRRRVADRVRRRLRAVEPARAAPSPPRRAHDLGRCSRSTAPPTWCIAVIPIIFAAAPLSRAATIAIVLVYEAATIGAMVGLTLAARTGISVLRGRWVERYGDSAAGGLIVATGIVVAVAGW